MGLIFKNEEEFKENVKKLRTKNDFLPKKLSQLKNNKNFWIEKTVNNINVMSYVFSNYDIRNNSYKELLKSTKDIIILKAFYFGNSNNDKYCFSFKDLFEISSILINEQLNYILESINFNNITDDLDEEEQKVIRHFFKENGQLKFSFFNNYNLIDFLKKILCLQILKENNNDNNLEEFKHTIKKIITQIAQQNKFVPVTLDEIVENIYFNDLVCYFEEFENNKFLTINELNIEYDEDYYDRWTQPVVYINLYKNNVFEKGNRFNNYVDYIPKIKQFIKTPVEQRQIPTNFDKLNEHYNLEDF